MPQPAQQPDAAAVRVLKLAAKQKSSSMDRDRIQKLSDNAAQRIQDADVRKAFLRLVDYFKQRERLAEIGQAQPAPLQDLLFIGRFGMVRTTEFAATQLSDELQELPLGEIIGSAPSVPFLARFAKRARGIASRIVENVIADPNMADRSAAMDWLVKHGKSAEIALVARLLISNRERLPHLPGYRDLLRIALKRDKGAVILQACLSAAEKEQAARERLISTFTDDAKLIANLLRAGLKLLRTRYADFVAQTLERWAPRFPQLEVVLRKPISTAVASLCVAILKQKNPPTTAEHLLGVLSGMSSDAVHRISESGDGERLWIMARASDLAASISGSPHVTVYGAGLIASTLQKAASGMSGEALLHALACNVGMTAIGSVGEQVSFNPEQHEDTSGGLLPNDAAVVKASGWSLNGRVVRRAQVSAA